MSIFDKPENIKNITFLLGFFSFLFLVLPGIAVLFIFERNIFISLDWIKLVLLASSATVPIVMLNIIASVILTNEPRKDDNDLSIDFFLGTIIGGFSIYIGLGISYFKQMTLESMLAALLIADVLVWFYIWKKRRNNRPKPLENSNKK